MIFFRVFPRTRCEQNKLSFEGFNNFASWDIFGEVPLFASFSSSSFGKKTTNSRFQGFKTIRISGQVPDDGSHWDDAFAVSWMTGFTSLLMVDGWWWNFFYNEKNWFQVFWKHFPFSTCLCTICTCIPKVNQERGFCWIEGIPGSSNFDLEVGETLNFTQSWCVQGYFDDKNSQG